MSSVIQTAGLMDANTLVAILASIVAIPLGVITFYLRALRDHLLAASRDSTQRIEQVDKSVRRVESRINDIERDYTVKEDWLRESMLARRNIQQLIEACARLDAQGQPVSRTITNTKHDALYGEGSD